MKLSEYISNLKKINQLGIGLINNKIGVLGILEIGNIIKSHENLERLTLDLENTNIGEAGSAILGRYLEK